MTTVTARVYGFYDGLVRHRQRESFSPSYSYHWMRNGSPVDIQVRNSDITGTNEYTELVVSAKDEAACMREIDGQVSDGIFENSRTGCVEIESVKEE